MLFQDIMLGVARTLLAGAAGYLLHKGVIAQDQVSEFEGVGVALFVGGLSALDKWISSYRVKRAAVLGAGLSRGATAAK